MAELFHQHAGYLAGLGARLLGRSDDADDLVQEVFLRAARTRALVREPDAARAWLRTIAVRLAWRRLRRRRFLHRLGLTGPESGDDLVDPRASSDERVLVRDLYRALDRLPSGLRVAWILRHIDEQPLEAVAAACDCSLATVKRRIQAAQQVLQSALSNA